MIVCLSTDRGVQTTCETITVPEDEVAHLEDRAPLPSYAYVWKRDDFLSETTFQATLN